MLLRDEKGFLPLKSLGIFAMEIKGCSAFKILIDLMLVGVTKKDQCPVKSWPFQSGRQKRTSVQLSRGLSILVCLARHQGKPNMEMGK